VPKRRSKPKTTLVVQNTPKRRKQRRNRGGNKQLKAGLSSNLTNEYFQSLINPWEHPGVKLGWGCLVPSTMLTAYLRYPAVCSAGGSLGLAAFPSVVGSFMYCDETNNFNGGGFQNMSNYAAIQASASEGRVVSVGIRAFPSVPLTSQPGVIYTGACVAQNLTQFRNITLADLVAMPTTHQAIGINGASATGRPIDPSSFTFSPATVIGYNSFTGNDVPFSVPYIVLTGLPATTVVLVEMVVNIECTAAATHTNLLGATPGDYAPTATLADIWTNVESMYRSAAHLLPPPGRAGEDAATGDSTVLSSLISGAGRGLISYAKGKLGQSINTGPGGTGQNGAQFMKRLMR